jgi:CzcA family heavy metal efflux pump
MWIVRLALNRPYTFIVFAILILILGGVATRRMATDIFPEINIPVVSVIWTYTGVAPEEMEKRIVTVSERAITTTVNDIEHLESQSMSGVSVIKIYFHPRAKVEAAVAQLTSITQTILRAMPPGIQPPLIIRYSASSVPILQMGISSKSLSEQELFDYGLNFIRTQLATVQGASVPLPYGGKPRQIMVDLNPDALFAKGLSPSDVSAAINAQNLILPAGNAKIGEREYTVRLNNSPETVEALNNLPIKAVGGAIIYIKDVAQVRDGFSVQTNIVRDNGRRSSLLTILKNGGASTLDVVKRVKEVLPKIKATLPPELDLKLLFDQSIFVKASLHDVIREGIIAACLTALMILLFLGSWRSTLIVTVSIPLAILCSIIALYLLGETINVMTLGGLALAVGILVDDATVEIENIHRNLAQGKEIKQAILDGAEQIALPTLVSTFSICIVFVPVFLLSGAAKSLFSPLAMAVVFAMLASYLLSRTVVPVMAMYLIPGEMHLHDPKHKQQNSLLNHYHERFNHHFETLRNSYKKRLEWGLQNKGALILPFVFFGLSALLLVPFVGQDFFPQVDAGQFRMHVRAAPGTRLEETEQTFADIEATVREIIPKEEIALILDNIGLPSSGINLAYSDNATVGAADGEILVSLHEGHKPTSGYIKQLRQGVKERFPGLVVFFQPADIISQILNFGLPAPIDAQVVGKEAQKNYALAKKLEQEISLIPGAADVHLHQVVNVPELRVNVDRIRAGEIGLTQRDVASNLLISLSSSAQTAPNFWLNPKNGVNYGISVQTPQYKINSLQSFQNTPIATANLSQPQLLANLATIERKTTMAVVNHYNVQPTYDIYANIQDRDLGGVAADIDKVLKKWQKNLPKGSSTVLRGQVQSMRDSFSGLLTGLAFAIILVYLLMVVNFQSWLDPLIIMMALPGALGGIVWMLFITQTTFSVPSLMGAIMSIGVATANSILVVTFANDLIKEGKRPFEAALEAGYTRLRPVLMTAAAMIIGMLPMALGLGEGGEQNAPLGRAVIGGLLAATVATLFFVPLTYSLVHGRKSKAKP